MARFGRGGGGTGDGTQSTKAKVPIVGVLLTALSVLIIPLWILAFLGWCVQLGGLSAVQYNSGRRYLQFDWFVTALEFVTLFFIPPYLLVRRSTPGIVALKAVVTVLEILRTDVWNNARLARGNNPVGANFTQVHSITNPGLNASRARIDTLFAGYLITAAFNILLLTALGNLPSLSAQDGEKLENKGKERYADQARPAMAEPYSSTAVATAGPNETVTTVTQGPIYPGEAAAGRV